ncbi:MAG: type VI secretion system-associated FHA domain protein TagH, partial [Povalibacter sp.]
MILTLEVTGNQAERLGSERRKVFHAMGGTIGRLPDNDWVLADPYVSGRHALIRYLNGRFFIEDTSTNGVFVNAPDSRLPKGQAHPLKNGDLIFIDAYQINVSMERDAKADEEAANDPLALLQNRVEQRRAPKAEVRRSSSIPKAPEQNSDEDERTASLVVQSTDAEDPDNNLTEWYGSSEIAPADPAPRPPQASVRAVPEKAQQRPPTRPAVAARPSQKLAPSPRPSAAAEKSAEADSLRVLLEAAGIDDLEPSDELAQTFGEILRVVVTGLMEVLRSREQLKEELRIRSTTFKSANNNPLKFSADAEDAFHNLLVKQNSAYLAPAEAFAEALQDVRDHQQAVQAAQRLAFETMLAQFD